MEVHFQLSDAELEQQFRTATLNPELFSHEAHLRLAWVQIRFFGLEKAEENLCQQIQFYDKKYDTGTKFHKTLTIAATKIVAHFMAKSQSENFADFIVEFPQLNNHFKELIAAHYSTDILQNPIAKEQYMLPDLLVF